MPKLKYPRGCDGCDKTMETGEFYTWDRDASAPAGGRALCRTCKPITTADPVPAREAAQRAAPPPPADAPAPTTNAQPARNGSASPRVRKPRREAPAAAPPPPDAAAAADAAMESAVNMTAPTGHVRSEPPPPERAPWWTGSDNQVIEWPAGGESGRPSIRLDCGCTMRPPAVTDNWGQWFVILCARHGLSVYRRD